MRRAAAALCSRNAKISLASICTGFFTVKIPKEFFGGALGRASKVGVRLLSRRRKALRHPMQAFEVVGQADQLPFQSHFFFPAQ